MAADATLSPAAGSPRPPVVAETDREDRPGVVPGGTAHRPATASEPGEERRPGEQIVEVAPDDPAKIIEVAPQDPGTITEVGPEVQPSEVQPEIGPEVQPEIGPEVQPQDPQPYRPEPSEVGPEVGPEVIPEVAPEVRPSETDPSEVIFEVAPEEPSER